MDKKIIILALLLIPVAAVWLLHQQLTGFTIYNDGIGYYIYARSLVIDKDVNFTNEWQYYNTSYSRFSNVPRGINAPSTTTPKGYPENFYTIGNSLMWLPFFLIAHIPLLIFAKNAANGYSLPYELATGTATLLYGLLAIIISYKLCRKFYSGKTALVAAITIWYGTAAFWYHSIEPSMSHINSMLLNTAFIYLWITTLEKRKAWQWTALGAIAGLIMLVRQQEAIILILPAAEILTRILKEGLKAAKQTIKAGILLAAGMTPLLIMQAVVWKMLHGSYLIYSYAGSHSQTEGGGWAIPQLIPLIFSTEGMIRTPALLIGLAGLLLFARKHGFKGWTLLALAAAQIIITSSWNGWNNGYGLRFLVGLMPVFALGIAEIMERLAEKSRKIPYAIMAALIAANIAGMTLFLLKEVGAKIPITEIPKLAIKLL